MKIYVGSWFTNAKQGEIFFFLMNCSVLKKVTDVSSFVPGREKEEKKNKQN